MNEGEDASPDSSMVLVEWDTDLLHSIAKMKRGAIKSDQGRIKVESTFPRGAYLTTTSKDSNIEKRLLQIENRARSQKLISNSKHDMMYRTILRDSIDLGRQSGRDGL